MQNETIDKLKNAGYITVTDDSQGIADKAGVPEAFPYEFVKLPDITVEVDSNYEISTGALNLWACIFKKDGVVQNKIRDYNKIILFQSGPGLVAYYFETGIITVQGHSSQGGTIYLTDIVLCK